MKTSIYIDNLVVPIQKPQRSYIHIKGLTHFESLIFVYKILEEGLQLNFIGYMDFME